MAAATTNVCFTPPPLPYQPQQPPTLTEWLSDRSCDNNNNKPVRMMDKPSSSSLFSLLAPQSLNGTLLPTLPAHDDDHGDVEDEDGILTSTPIMSLPPSSSLLRLEGGNSVSSFSTPLQGFNQVVFRAPPLSLVGNSRMDVDYDDDDDDNLHYFGNDPRMHRFFQKDDDDDDEPTSCGGLTDSLRSLKRARPISDDEDSNNNNTNSMNNGGDDNDDDESSDSMESINLDVVGSRSNDNRNNDDHRLYNGGPPLFKKRNVRTVTHDDWRAILASAPLLPDLKHQRQQLLQQQQQQSRQQQSRQQQQQQILH
mmetsp:Transcript_20511/g.44415  ORF Transcript_20511/g.44415 Transcript_20511/m.44415 type:complete len:310 (-) Transcript_20511:62-991(-)